jgi:hypothetical protein
MASDMSVIEIECRVSWANAALRFYAPKLDALHAVYANWHQYHAWCCNQAYGRPFTNA